VAAPHPQNHEFDIRRRCRLASRARATLNVKRAIPIRPVPLPDQEEALYAVRKKIYPRSVGGWFATWRWSVVFITQLVFYGFPWFTWNERQAVLFDLGARKFYIFGIVFWPQDFIYLTILLLICAYSLFLFTTVAGRLWCGYACPQTVYTEIFLWIERTIEGDHVARKRLDSQPLSVAKLGKKSAKHAVWLAVSVWTALTFVGYFTPIRELIGSFVAFSTGPWETFWILFYGLATYGNAGWMREQVCKYMCPYARFQGVMFDRDTLLITYDSERGEARGARSRKADPRALGLGDCVDCNVCVQVCPTGIDIRNGQQYECIGCAACIDGCDQVMDKMGYPKGLIRYATLNAVQQHFGWDAMVKRVFRPRVLFYTVILWAIIIVAGVTLYQRAPIKADVIRDRGVMAREVAGGLVENVYRLQLMNTREAPMRIDVRPSGIESLAIHGVTLPIELGPASTRMVPITLRADPAMAGKGSNRIDLELRATLERAGGETETVVIHEKAAFFKP
jgi:cytochrome c oxidase accessory protein FixG